MTFFYFMQKSRFRISRMSVLLGFPPIWIIFNKLLKRILVKSQALNNFFRMLWNSYEKAKKVSQFWLEILFQLMFTLTYPVFLRITRSRTFLSPQNMIWAQPLDRNDQLVPFWSNRVMTTSEILEKLSRFKKFKPSRCQNSEA